MRRRRWVGRKGRRVGRVCAGQVRGLREIRVSAFSPRKRHGRRQWPVESISEPPPGLPDMFAVFGHLSFHPLMKTAFLALLSFFPAPAFADVHLGTNETPQDWRAEKRLIDLHQHLDYTPEHLTRAIKIMD